VGKLGIIQKTKGKDINDKDIKKNRIKVKENLQKGNMDRDKKGVESSGTQPPIMRAIVRWMQISGNPQAEF
jgi:hypothetical protein